MRCLIIFSGLIIVGSSIPISQNEAHNFNSDLKNENYSSENRLPESENKHKGNKIESEEPSNNDDLVSYSEETMPFEKEERQDYSDIEELEYQIPKELPEHTFPYKQYASSQIHVQPPKVLPILPHPPKVSYFLSPHLPLTKYKSNLPYYFGLPRMSPLESLPPVHSTYIHGLDEARYDEKELWESSLLTPNVVRIQRTLPGIPRDEYHDLLAQLEHDAVMPNILPTMAVRQSGHSAPQFVSYGDTVAVFPQSASESAIAILLSCAPQVDAGVLAPKMAITEEESYRRQDNTEPFK